MTAIETKIKKCIEPIINKLGYYIYDIIYEKEGKENYLRVFIDKADGISLNDCENVNNSITDILDEKDFIKGQYMLEISSPGIERRIREKEHLEQNIEKKIEVHTFKAIEKQKILIGILKEYNEDSIKLEVEQIEKNTKNNKKKKEADNQTKPIRQIIEIEKSNIIIIKTVYDWKE